MRHSTQDAISIFFFHTAIRTAITFFFMSIEKAVFCSRLLCFVFGKENGDETPTEKIDYYKYECSIVSFFSV